MGKIRRMFPGGNTSQGFSSLHDNIIGLNRNALYILKGMPGGGKSSLMKEIGKRALEEDFSVEYHHCPSDPSSIDGIVINELGIGIIDGTPPHAMDPVYPGLGDKIVNLAVYIDSSKIAGHKDEIAKAKTNNKKAYRRVFNYFKAARLVYDEIEEAHKEYVDFNKVNNMSKEYLDEIFSREIVEGRNYKFKTRYMFSNAYTPQGYFDYTETIIDGVKHRYYLDGEIGTGKSTFLKRVVERANMENFHIEIYHNPFIPEKIESLLIHELDLIISSNDKIKKGPHNTIDFNQFFDKSKIDNQEEYIIFEKLIEKGTESLNMAKDNHFIQETIYKKSINYKGIDEEKERIWEEIKSYF